MKNLIKNHTFYFWLIAVVSLLLSFILLYKYSNTNNRLNQVEVILHVQKAIMRPSDLDSSEAALKIDSLSRRLEVQEIKEEYYLDQLNILSDWFILYITGLIALFGFVGYSKLKSLEQKVEEQEKKLEEKFVHHENKFKVFEADLLTSQGFLLMLSSDTFKHNKQWKQAFMLGIFSISCFASSAKMIGLSDGTKDSINEMVDSLDSILHIYKQALFSDEDYKIITNTFQKILEDIYDKEVRDKIFKLWRELENIMK